MMDFSEIKLVCTDVDGCLTDGIYQVSDPGINLATVITKSFYTRDFYAIEQLLKKDIKVCIVTQSHDKVIIRQILRIGSHSDLWREAYRIGQLLVLSTDNKEETIDSEVLKKKGLNWDNVAYIGDAENDIECMKKAAYTGCPSDAIEKVKDNSNYISEFLGGHGAVYDFCMHIIEKMEK